MPPGSRLRYGFGRNWQRYLAETDSSLDARLADARRYLAGLIPWPDLQGHSFLDVGSGSGLFSLAARALGAAPVVSLDYDADAVAATEQLRQRVQATDWQVLQGDMLDAARLAALGTFDFVHCAGVAHHTGDMWRALANLDGLVAPNGILFVSIYNRMALMSPLWRRVKWLYNRLGPLNVLIFYPYVALWIVYWLLRLRNPVAAIRNYGRGDRGMSFFRDVDDWLGGYPYEYATCGELFAFFHDRGFDLVRLDASTSWGLNNFVFVRRAAA